MSRVFHEYEYSSDVGTVAVCGVLEDGIWDTTSFRTTAAMEELPDSDYLAELLMYATLEGGHEVHSLVLCKEEGYDPSWCWADNPMGEVLQSIVFTPVTA